MAFQIDIVEVQGEGRVYNTKKSTLPCHELAPLWGKGVHLRKKLISNEELGRFA